MDDGSVVTSAGVSAGIDGALHVVARLCGMDVAHGVAESIEYNWQPDEFPGLIAGPGTVGQFTLAQKVLQQLLNGDMDAAWAEYNAALGTPREPELPSDLAINQIGYLCLLDGEIDTANGVFTLNVEAHPEAYNTWDSLGEAYMEAGEKLKAIECYRNSLELNPDNDNGVKMLKKLDAD